MRHEQSTTVYHRRIVSIGVLIALVMLLLIVRLWYIQVTRSDYYREKAEQNRLRIHEEPAPRGLILDRRGRVLVENELAFSLVLRREYMHNKERLLQVLQRYFGLERQQVEAKLEEYRSVPVVFPITLKNRLKFKEIAFVESHQQSFPELSLDNVSTRHYVYGPMASHLLGYTGEITPRELERTEFAGLKPGDVIGKNGLEREYNRRLMGRKGVVRLYTNSIGQTTGILDKIPPQNGQDLRLSLDLDLQQEAEKQMADYTGALVALDPRTGEIYCMVSKPEFDPNIFTGNLTPQAWKELIENPHKPLQNKVIRGTYSPGSIFKVLVALAGLGEGEITPQTSFFCGGQTNLLGRIVHCWNAGGHGEVHLIDAITNSCNIYFYNVGLKLGVDRIHHWALLAGFGRKTGIDLPGEQSGLIPSTAWKERTYHRPWYTGETVSVAIGQGAVSVTPLQVASFMAAVARNRVPPKPTLLYGGDASATAGKPLFPVDSWRIVEEGMEDVVSRGTGTRARLPGIRVAGKTGTAQVISTKTAEQMDDYEKRFKEHSWFACFAPVDNPRIAIAVIVEHGGHGGAVAAPLAAGVLEKYFQLYPEPAGSTVKEVAHAR